MIEVSSEVRRAYEAAGESCLAVHHAESGLLAMSGADRLDFLNRMSTQQLRQLDPPARTQTVLTNALGRIVDALEVIATEDQLLLLTSPQRATAVKEWLQGYIFFQDDVAIEDVTADWSHWGLYGPSAGQAADELVPLGGTPESGDLLIQDQGHRWPVQQPVPGIELLLRGEARQRAEQSWPRAGPASAYAEAYEILRIEAGLPKAGAEISEHVTPLDVGLDRAVSFDKGCYIGQEVIARMESRDRRRRILRRVRLDSQAVAAAEIHQAERVVGRLTSVAQSPEAGWIGLALLRPRALDADENGLQVGEGSTIARVIDPDPASAPV